MNATANILDDEATAAPMPVLERPPLAEGKAPKTKPAKAKAPKKAKAAPASKATKGRQKAAGGKADAKAKKDERGMSQLDAAAVVLKGAKEPMSAKALVEAMGKRGLWTSPGGKTPDATLSAAIQREINVKGKESRFKKPAPGRFSLK